MSDLIKRLCESRSSWEDGLSVPTDLECEAADALEQLQEEHGDMNLANVKYEKRIEELEAALKQAYLDGGCREDEAIEMVGALIAGDSTPKCEHDPISIWLGATECTKCGSLLTVPDKGNEIPPKPGGCGPENSTGCSGRERAPRMVPYSRHFGTVCH